MSTQLRSQVFVLAWLALPLFALANEPAYRAQMVASSGTRNIPGPSDGNNVSNATLASVISRSTVTESGGPVVSTGNSLGTAQTGPGRIEFFGSSSGTTSAFRAPSVGSSGTSGYASLNDNFTILAPGCAACTDALGVLSFAVRFDGRPTATGTAIGDIVGDATGIAGGSWEGSGEWRSFVNVQAPAAWSAPVPYIVDATATGRFHDGTNVASPGFTSTGLAVGTYTFEIGVRFGMPVYLQWQAYMETSSRAGSSGNEASLAAQSAAEVTSALSWAGITGLRLLDGTPVAAYTALNPNGIDYVQSFVAAAPVPEPSSAALALAGALTVLGLARRRLVKPD
jgi:hypothetical protein